MPKRKRKLTRKQCSVLGGKAILAKRGVGYFSKLGKRSAKIKKKNKKQNEQA